MRDGLNNLLTYLGQTIADLPRMARWFVLMLFGLLVALVVAGGLLSFVSFNSALSLLAGVFLVLGVGLLVLSLGRSVFPDPKFVLRCAVILLVVGVLLKAPWGDFARMLFSAGGENLSVPFSGGGLNDWLAGARREDISRTGLSVLQIWVPSWILLNGVLVFKVLEGRVQPRRLLSANIVWIALLFASSLLVRHL